jgi:mRNA interferase MazF
MRRGDIVLIKYPFTDLSSTKVRPAIVVSSDEFTNHGEDAIFVCISSQTRNVLPPDLILSPSDPEFRNSGLRKASLVKIGKIICLSKSLASRLLGEAGPNTMQRIKERLINILDLN